MGRLSPRQAIPGLEPTEKQIRCVNVIVNKLRINPPTEFTKAAYSAFISEYMAESKQKPYERRNNIELEAGDTSSIDAFVGKFRIVERGATVFYDTDYTITYQAATGEHVRYVRTPKKSNEPELQTGDPSALDNFLGGFANA